MAGGKTNHQFSKTFNCLPGRLAVQKDGKMVVIGYDYDVSAPGKTCYIARFNADGSLDQTFGGTGKIKALQNEHFLSNAIVAQQNGKIIAAGTNDVYQVMVARFNADVQ